jgi:hypothetical protein
LTGKINLKAKSEISLSDGVLIAIDDFMMGFRKIGGFYELKVWLCHREER